MNKISVFDMPSADKYYQYQKKEIEKLISSDLKEELLQVTRKIYLQFDAQEVEEVEE